MRRAWLVACLVAACDCGSESAQTPEPTPDDEPAGVVASLPEYFPAALGDRWRFGSGDDRTTRVVLARQGDVAVILGDDLTGPMRVRIGDEAITTLTPDGTPAGDLIQAPMHIDHGWSYDVGDVSCEARYQQMDAVVEVADLTLNACVIVNRRCVHPAGKPFADETTEHHTETYCPHVGRVSETLALDPAPRIEGVDTPMEARRDDELLFYRVGGAPSPTMEEFTCDALLLTPPDVSAACGGQLQITEASTVDGRCTLTFRGAEGDLVVRAERGVTPQALLGTDEATAQGDAFVVRNETHFGRAFMEGEHAVATLAPEAACSPEGLALMDPLLRSLVRR